MARRTHVSMKARAGAAIANAIRGWAFPSSGSGPWGLSGIWPQMLPSSDRYNYQLMAGDPMLNSVVVSSIQWSMRTFPEAPIMVRKKSSKKDMPNHSMVTLLDQPNPFYDGNLLMQAVVADFNAQGNAYILKARNAVGAVVELWWIPSFMIRPAWPIDGSNYIESYIYEVYNKRYFIDPKDIVHIRFGLDPNNIRVGLSPLAALLREIFTDNEASDFSASLVRNLGIPGVIIAPAPQGGDEKTVFEDPEDIKRMFMDKFSGSRRGEPMVLDGPTTVHVLSFSPEQMNLTELRRVPEERISAALGIPAVVVGLGAGLDRSTFTNMESALDFAYGNNILPTQRLIAKALNHQLMPDLGNINTEECYFDISLVRALQPDQNELATRTVQLYKGDIIKRAEARLAIGQQPASDGSDDLYFSQVQLANKLAGAPAGGAGGGNSGANTGDQANNEKPPADDGGDSSASSGQAAKPKSASNGHDKDILARARELAGVG